LRIRDGSQTGSQHVDVIERRLTATADYRPWPQAAVRYQWPGTGRSGGPYFDEFRASQIRMVADGATVGRPMRHAGRAQLERIGRSVVLTHSHAGSRPALIFGSIGGA
jgi:hypothetical protein